MLIPILVSLGVAGYLIATRRQTGAGDMKDAIQVGDIVHITPSMPIQGITYQQQIGYLQVRVDSVDANTLRGPVTHAGGTVQTFQQLPTPLGPLTFPKSDVITILRNGREIA